MVALSPSPARPAPGHASPLLRIAALEAELATERVRRRTAEAEVARLRAVVERTAQAAENNEPSVVRFPEVQSPEHHRRLMRLGLSARQAEVLFWMANGKTTREIATIIGAAAGTVRKHCEQIYARLGVEGHRSAMLRAYEVLRAG